MSKRQIKSVRLGGEGLGARLVPAVDAFIWFESPGATASVAVQATETSQFDTVFASRVGGEVVNSDAL